MEKLPTNGTPQSLIPLTPSTEPSPKWNVENLKRGKEMAERMLLCFPDYGKAPPDYVKSIAEVMGSYPPEVQERLANRIHGIPARCKYLPTCADIAAFVEEYQAKNRPPRDVPRYNHDPYVAVNKGNIAKGIAEWNRIKAGLEESAVQLRRSRKGKVNGRYESWRIPQPPSEELKALLYEQGYCKGPAMEEYWREREGEE